MTMGGTTSSSSLSTTPSGSTYDMTGSGMPVAGSVAGNRALRTRSKSRSTQNDYRMRLTAEQKCEIALKEIDELKTESHRTNNQAQKKLDSFNAILEESDIRISEIRKEMYEFNRDVILAAKTTPSKKISAETLMKFLENRIKQRDTLIEKLKLKNDSMRKKRNKLTSELKEVTWLTSSPVEILSLQPCQSVPFACSYRHRHRTVP